jgi:hypothetical protein
MQPGLLAISGCAAHGSPVIIAQHSWQEAQAPPSAAFCVPPNTAVDSCSSGVLSSSHFKPIVGFGFLSIAFPLDKRSSYFSTIIIVDFFDSIPGFYYL